MKKLCSSQSLAARASEALVALLELSSSVKLLNLDLGKPEAGGGVEMLAHIGVLGHEKLLACRVKPQGQIGDVLAALDELRGNSPGRQADATPVLVAPSLSTPAQELCTRCHTSYVDFEGNGRLEVGELFIRRRSLACSGPAARTDASTQSGAPEHPVTKIPPTEAGPAGYGVKFALAHSSRA